MYTLRVVLAVTAAASAVAADWPQWRGPKRDGAMPEAVEPWTGGLTPAWSAKVGFGYSTPVVAAGRVFVHARVVDRAVAAGSRPGG